MRLSSRGDLHLRNAEVPGYLLLGLSVKEPKYHDAAVSVGQSADQRSQNDASFCRALPGVLAP